MVTDICSIWAYDDIIESGYLGKKQALVLSIFTKAYPYSLSGSEAVSKLSVYRGSSETVRNRINDDDYYKNFDKL